MDRQEYFLRAREADALASAAEDLHQKRTWEYVAGEYRLLAQMLGEERRDLYRP